MLRLDECAGRSEAGRKAETLARLRAAGLPTLDGVVLLPDEPVERDPLEAALARFGGAAFAVRSSSSLEDAPGASAAGVFESVIGARGVEGVERAIARVRASAGAEPVQAYLRARGLPGDVRMAVLIQPVVRAERLAVARTLDGGGFLLEERRAGEPEWGDVEARTLPAGDPGALARDLARIEGLLGGPVDVELARAGEQVTFLQARPRAWAPRPPSVTSVIEGHWRLDAEHNPEPLSAAQAGLVARVEALEVGARQRVIDGWLFVAREPGRNLHPLPLAELRARFDQEIAPDCEARLRAVEAGTLDAALDAYGYVYRRYVGEVAAGLRRAREQLDQLLRMNLGQGLAESGELLAGLGGVTVERDQSLWALGRATPEERPARLEAYQARFGALAPAWDVAVPPDDESPTRVLAAAEKLAADARSPRDRHSEAEARAEAAAHATLERLDRMARRAFKALLPLVRAALPVAEDDDLLFFRAQRAVRRALLRRAVELRLPDATQVFDLPLEVARDPAGHDLAALAAAGRAARLASARHVPPVAIDDGHAHHRAPEGRAVLRGHATAGRARGRAFVLRSTASAPASLPDGAVLVVPAILPSLAYLLPGARALVTDHGGATSHGATLAREYGVPAVLGTATATALPDGAELYVDADAGRAYLL
jgi:phosphohistidine swiveling domain-containing protein